MRGVIRLIALLAVGLLSNSSVAQVATDNELFAAYCVGALSETQEPTSPESERYARIDPSIARNLEAIRKLNDQTKQRRLRFESYLAARGFQANRNDQAAAGVKLALQRGRNDGIQCGKSIDACISSCNQISEIDLFGKCLAPCGHNDVCASTGRCHKADNLPF